eukprot:6196285-Pleurochrysis_carterae.AAC.2
MSQSSREIGGRVPFVALYSSAHVFSPCKLRSELFRIAKCVCAFGKGRAESYCTVQQDIAELFSNVYVDKKTDWKAMPPQRQVNLYDLEMIPKRRLRLADHTDVLNLLSARIVANLGRH